MQAESLNIRIAEWSCEFVGTALMLFIGISAVCFDFGRGMPVAHAVSSTSWRLLITGMIFAAGGSLVAVSPLGRRSGAHLNPAVSVAFWLEKHMHPHDLGGYVVSQFAGAILGAAAAKIVWGSVATSVQLARTLPKSGLGNLPAALIEVGITAVLILVIFTMVSSASTARWTPLAVWATVAVMVWQEAPFTGTSLNPARSFGPDLVSGDFAHLWPYFVGPTCGALVASAIWSFVPRQTLTARLFHDHTKPTTLRSWLSSVESQRSERRRSSFGDVRSEGGVEVKADIKGADRVGESADR